MQNSHNLVENTTDSQKEYQVEGGGGGRGLGYSGVLLVLPKSAPARFHRILLLFVFYYWLWGRSRN